MKIYIVTKDLGDGDVGLRFFPTEDMAEKYMSLNEEGCYHESNPTMIDTDNFRFDKVE